MMRQKRENTRPPKSTTKRRRVSSNVDTVGVYCRLRPLFSIRDESCITLISSTTIQLRPPDETKSRKIVQCGFNHVFSEQSSQRELFEHVAVPLMEELLDGKNGLLFTYGVTGSGKTFTMTGEPNNPGLMPRCIHTLFNSLKEYLVPKFLIKSDKMNGYEIQTLAEALTDRIIEVKFKPKPIIRTKHVEPQSPTNYSNDGLVLFNVNTLCQYAIFVSYIEIYNNSVYDLLDESGGKTLQAKILREDWNHNVYVNGVLEVEVTSAEEAFDLLNRGQKRKKMGHTKMNAESSRSHSIFTLRLVRGKFDPTGERLLKGHTLVSAQLSLVDLAGSERNKRAQTSGQHLKEAGSINNSLMALRTCLENLRDNQLYNTKKHVPYRESRLTHLFRNYFEGKGAVKMIVCVNPSVRDYDETMQVMKFAEMTQEVRVHLAESKELKFDIEEIVPTEKSKTKDISKKGVCVTPKEEYERNPEALKVIDDFILTSNKILEKENIPQMLHCLKTLLTEKCIRAVKARKKRDLFRTRLVKLNNERIVSASELESLRAQMIKKRVECRNMKSEEYNTKAAYDSLQQRCIQKDALIEELQNQVKETNLKLNQNRLKKDSEKRKLEEKITQEFDVKMRQQREYLQAAMKEEKDKIELVTDILTSKVDNKKVRTVPHTPKVTDTPRSHVSRAVQSTVPRQVPLNSVSRAQQTVVSRGTPPVANVRYRRSKSAGDVWLEHRPPHPTPVGTVLQPYFKRRKSVTKLTDIKDVTCPRQSKYLLIDQGQTNTGDLETKLYKGDIIPTCGGGAQIIFDDVEKLTQESPTDRSKNIGKQSPQESEGFTGFDVVFPQSDKGSNLDTGFRGFESGFTGFESGFRGFDKPPK